MSKIDMTQFRLAKQAAGLSRAEKQTLIAIADTCSMADSVCRKSASTVSKEYGVPRRMFQYGVRGRKRADGTDYYPGLIARGIVTATEKQGEPTVFQIQEDRLRLYCQLTQPAPVIDLRTNEVAPAHKVEPTCAQNNGHLRTNEAEPAHSGAQVLKAVPKDNSNTNSTAVPTATPAPVESKPKAQAGEIKVQGRCSNCGALGSCDSDCPPCDECGEQICAHRFEAVELTDQERAWLAQRKANPQLFEELYQ